MVAGVADIGPKPSNCGLVSFGAKGLPAAEVAPPNENDDGFETGEAVGWTPLNSGADVDELKEKDNVGRASAFPLPPFVCCISLVGLSSILNS